ncbi:MAG: hypothetical protein U0361_00690 [Nitrospiraceae bacterium]
MAPLKAAKNAVFKDFRPSILTGSIAVAPLKQGKKQFDVAPRSKIPRAPQLLWPH